MARNDTNAQVEGGPFGPAVPLSLKQASARYGIGERKLRELIHRQELPFIPWGSHMRLLPETLDAYFRNQQRLHGTESE